jgi:hypothetical protein
MYCTYYYVGGAKSHAGNCITVTWQQPLPPQITSFTSSCSTCHGQYTLSWRTQYADSCTLNGQSAPVNGSQTKSSPPDTCTDDRECDTNSGFRCRGNSRSVTHTLSCSNSAGSTSQSLTVDEVWNSCKKSGPPPYR